MLQSFIRVINRVMFFVNGITLIALLASSILGIWEFLPHDSFYWKVLISLCTVLLFNILTLFCLSHLYRKTLKMVDIFGESEFTLLRKAGANFGEMALIEELPRSASAVCVKDCKLISINDKRFYDLLREAPFFANEVMKTMSRRLRKSINDR